VRALVKRLSGWLYGDRGYLSQALTRDLLQTHQLRLVTKLKANMKARLLTLSETLMLRKRSLLETIIDQFKNISQIEHTRHRSFTNLAANVLCGLIAYCHQPRKPSLRLDSLQLDALIPN
jgi:hypothetical protein